jgi:ankyrin repeat protein
MMRNSVAVAVMAAGLAMATAAPAQQFSEGYRFIEAVKKGDGTKLTQILNEPGSTIINTREQSTGMGALHIVTRRADLTYLGFLLGKGADPNLRDGEGNTALLLAVTGNFQAGVDLLLRIRANVNLGNSRGETPLMRAVQLRNLELVRLLLANGADPDQTDNVAGMSARDYAKADTRSPAIAKLLADAPKATRRATAGPKL